MVKKYLNQYHREKDKNKMKNKLYLVIQILKVQGLKKLKKNLKLLIVLRQLIQTKI